MATTTAPVPRGWREGRRFRAWELKQQGWTQSLIAAALGVTPGAVSQWMTRVRDRLESPAPRGAGHPARRGGHRHLVRGALASPQTGAQRTGQTIVWVDESGFYLLPGVV